ncbi:MAG: DsbA family protein [Myxococcota bacterium]
MSPKMHGDAVESGESLVTRPFDAFRSDRPLIAYVDFKSPYAFVATRPTYELAEALGVSIDWRPLTLDIPSFLGSARLDKDDRVIESQRSTSQWQWVKYAYHDARRYARLRGWTLRGTTKIWDTTLAGMGLLWAKAQSDSLLRAYLETTFERFWRRELDVEDVAVVESLLRGAGTDVRGFRDSTEGEARARYLAQQVEIFGAGIFGVPGYVVDGEYYWGREHLPRIGWILAGRRGTPPDVAYRGIGTDLR